jgi:hypothetical protein
LAVIVKVVGTGTPEVAKVRFEACEADVLRAELALLHARLEVVRDLVEL